MAYDQEVLDAIFARAGQVNDPSKRNRYLRAALQTGIVESGLQNLNHGDADSLGWRQERASLYKNPTNITASVNRFFDEAAQLDRGQHSWELAADVQRPDEQYRGRYHDVAHQAAGLLKQMGGASPSGGSGSPASAASAAQLAPAAQPSTDPGAAGDFTGVLAGLLGQQQKAAPQTTLAPLGQSALKMPTGFQPLTSGGGPEAPGQQQGVSQVLGLLESLRGTDPANGTGGGSTTADGPQTASDPFTRVQAQRDAGINGSNYSEFKARADLIDAAKMPYKWGGGHGGKVDVNKNLVPLDCSGAVSAVLGIDPRVSGQFENWGKAGDSGNKGITVAANDHHVLMKIDGHWFGTSATNPGGGAGWIPQAAISKDYLKGFTLRHL